MAGAEEPHDWMIVSDGIIERLGRGPVPESPGNDLLELDLSEETILPAFCDCHVHFLETGLLEIDLDLGQATRFEDILELIFEASRSPSGSMLRAHSFDPDLLAGGRYLTRDELDAISNDLPIFIRRRDGHSCVVNSRAMTMLGVSDDLPGVEKDGTGRATGVLRLEANGVAALASRESLTRDERISCFHSAAWKAVERGIGVVHALVGNKDPSDSDIELILDVQDELPIELVVFAQTEDVGRVAGLGLPRIGGCLLLDGSFSSGTAALADPYTDREGRGVLYYTDDELTGFFRSAHERGLQISVHALGGRAIGQALACYEAACGQDCASARHRIEHCELPSAGHIASILRLGIAPCVQPTFELMWGGPGGMMEKRLGGSRAARSNPYRSLLEAGVPLAGGSDSYVTPMDSLLGIHAAVNRPNEAERISVFDAVSLFTNAAAWISFDEGRRGTLEPGKEASFVVLGEDPFEVSPDSIREIAVTGLYGKGRRLACPA
jgi:predicted amidohydrolase YtcJ